MFYLRKSPILRITTALYFMSPVVAHSKYGPNALKITRIHQELTKLSHISRISPFGSVIDTRSPIRFQLPRRQVVQFRIRLKGPSTCQVPKLAPSRSNYFYIGPSPTFYSISIFNYSSPSMYYMFLTYD